MFDQKKVKEIILTTLVADGYSLGAHWVYDENQLAKAELDWNELNKPLAIWHKEKSVGEFTHYGDQAYWLYEFLLDKETFDEAVFLDYWASKMETYTGYIDGATRITLQNIKDNLVPSGSESTDLSIVGRIVPLLLVSKTKEEFLSNVEKFTKLTHNSAKALNTTKFFGEVLWLTLEGVEVESAILQIRDDFDTKIQAFIDNGLKSRNDDSFDTIRNFGPACDIEEGFSGIIHLLSKYDNLKDMLIANAKAGGDTSARAMIASAIFMANQPISQIPQSWLAIKATI